MGVARSTDLHLGEEGKLSEECFLLVAGEHGGREALGIGQRVACRSHRGRLAPCAGRLGVAGGLGGHVAGVQGLLRAVALEDWGREGLCVGIGVALGRHRRRLAPCAALGGIARRLRRRPAGERPRWERERACRGERGRSGVGESMWGQRRGGRGMRRKGDAGGVVLR